MYVKLNTKFFITFLLFVSERIGREDVDLVRTEDVIPSANLISEVIYLKYLNVYLEQASNLCQILYRKYFV